MRRLFKDPDELRKSVFAAEITHRLIVSSSEYYVYEFAPAGRYAVRILTSYAEADYPELSQRRRYGHTLTTASQFLFAAAIAHTKLKSFPEYTAEQQALVERWLRGKLLGPHIKFKETSRWTTEGDGVRGPTSTARVSGVTVNCCNPLRYNSGRVQIDMALMAGSILFNDQEGFESAIKGYVDVIDTMRADGSLPYQTVRGNAAIWYQNLGIQVLVMAAEMAALQGIDLSSYKAPSGATLHSAIAFLARYMDQPSLVYGYAAKNINPWRAGNRITDPDDHRYQFATWKLPRLQGDGASFLAWFEPYQRRFPNHPNISLMSDVVTPIAERGTPRSKMIQLPYPFRRANATGGLFNDYSGTITSCVFKEIP